MNDEAGRDVRVAKVKDTKTKKAKRRADTEIGVWNFARTCLWTSLIGVIIFWLHQPIRETADELPTIIGRADSITIGAWKIKLNTAFDNLATPLQRAAVNGLGSRDVSRLLELGRNGLTNCMQPRVEIDYYEDKMSDQILVQRQLVSIQDEPEQNKPPFSRCYSARPTDAGHNTQDFLVRFVYNFLNHGHDEMVGGPSGK